MPWKFGRRAFSCFLLLALCGCASVTGANNSKSHILYEHRTPIQKTAIIQAAQHGLLAQAGLNTDGIIDNAGEVSLGAAEIVKAVMGVGGFPFVIIPNIIKGAAAGGAMLKEETAEQEVSKLYWIEGETLNIDAEMPDHAKIKVNMVGKAENVENSPLK